MEEKSILSFIKTVSNMPLVKIDKHKYLVSTFASEYPSLLKDILEKGAYDAGVPLNIIDEKSREAINYEIGKSAAISFVSGLPGGIIGIGAVPADTVQFLMHALRIVQKLCYISGLPSFTLGDSMTDDDACLAAVYIGAMFEDKEAILALNSIWKAIAEKSMRIGFRVTSVVGYAVVSSILKSIGIKISSKGFMKSVSKALPLIGGAVSAGFTYTSLQKMSNRLYNKIKESKYSIS
ncbi:EcsC family protein [Brachyspira hampsonii]|uniref:EcsC family protein n=1 Tax=Brachyspira hampsonii TaxID=1287055 RepID=UPI000D34039B|nr:EcsC family protein [Brachyspira hampsonii]PTY39345.1 membrane protein [Brachyspira hampsonii bv. II]